MLLRITLKSRLSTLDHAPCPTYIAKLTLRTMSDNAKSNQKTYHKKATGVALNTVKKHLKDNELKLYGSCFW